MFRCLLVFIRVFVGNGKVMSVLLMGVLGVGKFIVL